MADWSNLPDDLLLLIAFRLFSVLELLRFRSVCTSWRTSVSADIKTFPSRPLIQLNPLVAISYGLDPNSILTRASFFRVSHSSSSKGWLIKYEAEGLSYGKFRLLNPLTRLPLQHMCKSIDLLKYTFSEIQTEYIFQGLRRKLSAYPRYQRIGHRIIGIDCDRKIGYWNGNIWTRIKDQSAHFCDMIVYKGLTYAVDLDGIVWWVSSSLGIFRYGPSFNENITECRWRDRRLVECCGVFYIVDRLIGRMKCQVSQTYYRQTVGFEVYKMDEELWKWVQVKSLGDYAFMMATDSCFSVLAHEFFGCLKNSIYFSDNKEYEVKVFKLDDSSIKTMSGDSQSCFQMFTPSFH